VFRYGCSDSSTTGSSDNSVLRLRGGEVQVIFYLSFIFVSRQCVNYTRFSGLTAGLGVRYCSIILVSTCG
jgi:hypothetical protein